MWSDAASCYYPFYRFKLLPAWLIGWQEISCKAQVHNSFRPEVLKWLIGCLKLSQIVSNQRPLWSEISDFTFIPGQIPPRRELISQLCMLTTHICLRVLMLSDSSKPFNLSNKNIGDRVYLKSSTKLLRLPEKLQSFTILGWNRAQPFWYKYNWYAVVIFGTAARRSGCSCHAYNSQSWSR